jgi:hypothetical protein
MARAVSVGACRPLSAADIVGAGHAAVSIQTAKEAWEYAMPSSSNAETLKADVAVLGVNLSGTDAASLMYWMEQSTAALMRLCWLAICLPGYTGRGSVPRVVSPK